VLPLIVFLALFLLLLAALALATTKLFAAKDATGQVTAPGWVGGCATGCALMFIGFVGVIAFIAGVAAISAAHSVERVVKSVPEMKVGAWLDRDKFVHHDAEHPFHVIAQWKGHSEPTDEIVRAIEELDPKQVPHDMLIRVINDYGVDDNGEPITVVEFAMAMDDDDAQELVESTQSALGDLKLADGVEITIRSIKKD